MQINLSQRLYSSLDFDKFVFWWCRCLRFLYALSASSVSLKVEGCHEAPDGSEAVGCPHLFSTPNLPPGYRHREMSRTATSLSSFNTGPVSRHESLSAGEDAPPGQRRFHATQTFFRTQGSEVSCVCLHSYQTG